MGTQEILHRTHNHSSLGGVIDHVDGVTVGDLPILHEPATPATAEMPILQMYLCQEPLNATAINSNEFLPSDKLCISHNPCGVGQTASIPAENTISSYGLRCDLIGNDPKECIYYDAGQGRGRGAHRATGRAQASSGSHTRFHTRDGSRRYAQPLLRWNTPVAFFMS